jgi:hypothetical protein
VVVVVVLVGMSGSLPVCKETIRTIIFYTSEESCIGGGQGLRFGNPALGGLGALEEPEKVSWSPEEACGLERWRPWVVEVRWSPWGPLAFAVATCTVQRVKAKMGVQNSHAASLRHGGHAVATVPPIRTQIGSLLVNWQRRFLSQCIIADTYSPQALFVAAAGIKCRPFDTQFCFLSNITLFVSSEKSVVLTGGFDV